jgi:hypothetical protein
MKLFPKDFIGTLLQLFPCFNLQVLVYGTSSTSYLLRAECSLRLISGWSAQATRFCRAGML